MSDNDTKMTESMSKEEMIDTLKGLVFGTFDRTTAKEREALDMVIKASEQKTVSRESYEHEYFLRKEFEIKIDKLQRQLEEQTVKAESILDKIRAEIVDTLYVDSLIFGELIDFNNGKISADDVIEEFNRVTRLEVLKIIDKYKAESEE